MQGGTWSQVGYDAVGGSDTLPLDLRAKNLRWKERYNVQLFFQAFNLPNCPNFGNNYRNTSNSADFMKPLGSMNPSGVTNSSRL